MPRVGWRQFRPRTKRYANDEGDVFVAARERLAELTAQLHGRIDAGRLDDLVAMQAERVVAHPGAAEWLALLILRAPGAARAQQHMDKHSHSYHSNQGRLFELIDFNDTFVSTVLALSGQQRRGFIDALKNEIEQFCRHVGTRSFTDDQYEAITRGLGREVAVYLGAIEQGYSVAMTSRAQDAMGVDMIITDPESGRSLNVDCKTPSAYHYRIKDLVQQVRLSAADGQLAEQLGYAQELNGHGNEAVLVTLLRVDPNEVGDIEDFAFVHPELLGERLGQLFARSAIQSRD